MKNNKSSVKLDGALASYMQWPAYLALVLVCFDICICLYFPAATPFVLIYTIIYLLISIMIWIFKRQQALRELTSFATEFNHAQHMMLKELDVPFGMLDMNGHLVWANNDLKDLISIERSVKEPISKIFNNDSLNVLPTVEEDVEYHISYGRNNYLMRLRLITPSEYGDTILWRAEQSMDAPDDSLIAMFLYDETESVALKKENFDEKMIVGLLYIDNFEEAFEGADEVRRSLVTAWVEREINKYMKPYDAIIKHLEKDRYMFVIKQRYLTQLEADRFSILENIRNLNIYDLTMTISIGVGVYTDSYIKAYEGAHEAIDLALGRGGDQAVVKRPSGISYYGGTTASQEKSTRVKARVKAHALREYMEGKEKVVVMGHTMADIDAVGASIGIYRIAKTLNKRCYICLTDPTTVIQVATAGFIGNPDYEEDMFVTGTKAKGIVDNDTLLVVVDVNRPSYTDTPDLLKQTNAVVVLDHHRQMSDKIDNAVLSYIEPYASSACEM
ncbi:MAG: DHH family phosphoesterase, partial [Lachnospiraceae bacterium]|nr:DHH family phosphoesterase [Lachnospiraceae bacterium]